MSNMMAANGESAREPPHHVGQESSRPERAAAQLCQLKIRFEFSQQSSSPSSPTPLSPSTPRSTPPLTPAAASKRRLETPASPLPAAACLPSVRALLAATVSRVESVVAANELQAATSVTTKLLETKNMATQTVTTQAVAAKFRSKEAESSPTANSQLQENSARVILSRLPDEPFTVQATSAAADTAATITTASAAAAAAALSSASSSAAANVSGGAAGCNSPTPPQNVICEASPGPAATSPTPAKVPAAAAAKGLLPNCEYQTCGSPAFKSQSGAVRVHGTPLRMPIVYVDDLMTSSREPVEAENDGVRVCSSLEGGKGGTSTNEQEHLVQQNDGETTSSTVRSLKRASEPLVPESTPKKQLALMPSCVRKKDSDCAALSPVMKDYVDSPGSPMTRSMSRRIEESTTQMPGIDGDYPASEPVIAVNMTSGSASSSESEESSSLLTTAGRRKAFLQRKVQFSKVSIYLFEREQGFTSVPSEGGSTLGMGAQHLELQEYSIEEYAEIKRLQLSLSMGAALPQGQDIEGFIVQPVPTRRRRELLRQCGVRNIDVLEKEELHMIRVSREQCGCSCVGQCLPGSCLCLELGIECQVDHGFYPCGCTVEGCSNPLGRHEFNRRKVKVHVKATCARANRELGLPEVFEEVITAADSPDNFASQEEVYTSSECSENSDYASPEEVLLEELDSLPDSNIEDMEEGLQQKQLSIDDVSISEDSDTATEIAGGPTVS